MIPQVKNSLVSIAVIFLGIPVMNCYIMYGNGDLQTWTQLPHALAHSSFAAFWACVGWILFKSPFSGKLTELLVTQTASKGDLSTTKITKLTLSEPEAPKPVETKPPE